jgi:DNA replication and repair protein RecF
MKISGQSEKRASELAKKLPVLVLGPETVDLLLDPPSIRRRFLNWGVFHVEPQFSDIWIAANRNLRQRNEILKRQGRTGSELDTWTMKLIELSEQIHVHRELYCQRFSAIFEEISGALTELHEIKCEYHRGWANQKDLATVYQEEMDSDLKRGYTQSGFHRADLKVSVAGQSAMTVCSRGELKVLAWSLIMSQGALLTTESGQQPVFLVDDLVSELDKEHREKICQHLIKNEGQVLATGVEAEMLKECWGVASRKVFHVELGNFTEEE